MPRMDLDKLGCCQTQIKAAALATSAPKPEVLLPPPRRPDAQGAAAAAQPISATATAAAAPAAAAAQPSAAAAAAAVGQGDDSDDDGFSVPDADAIRWSTAVLHPFFHVTPHGTLRCHAACPGADGDGAMEVLVPLSGFEP